MEAPLCKFGHIYKMSVQCISMGSNEIWDNPMSVVMELGQISEDEAEWNFLFQFNKSGT